MSDYERNKVVRYKYTEANFMEAEEDLYKLEDKHPDLFGRCANTPYFEITSTDGDTYIDYVLSHNYGEDAGDFGRIRKLYPQEVVKYGKLFEQLFPESGIKLTNFRLVDYCYYNGCEPPDYFDETQDDFYNEV